ncbi:MAG: hypothetical protein JSS43_25795 [Proteobacteria bacterium]|nr:hypothetical protein [Pseudomonadota bacterium]
MTVEVVAVGSSSQRMIGFLRMSASKTRTFLEDLSNERSPLVASGDEDGDVQIEFAVTEAGPALAVRKRGQRDALGRWAIKPEFNLKAVAADLLADLGLPYAPK